jgi:hypothetical protein
MINGGFSETVMHTLVAIRHEFIPQTSNSDIFKKNLQARNWVCQNSCLIIRQIKKE